MSTVAAPHVTNKQLKQEFERIFHEYSSFIYRTAYGVTGNAEDAEDVLQTIFLRLMRRELPPNLKNNPKAYLYRAAERLLATLETMAESNPAGVELLILRYVHNYSDADIGKMFGQSRGVVAVRLFRARNRLKKLMRESGERR
jgi:DNA-directed RNA polymerase specialized sigma24 family protein